MFQWSPNIDEITEWKPISGWNASFSPKDKIQCTNLYFFFTLTKGLKDNIAEIMSQMIIYKQKYANLKYSNEQEKFLQESLKTDFS